MPCDISMRYVCVRRCSDHSLPVGHLVGQVEDEYVAPLRASYAVVSHDGGSGSEFECIPSSRCTVRNITYWVLLGLSAMHALGWIAAVRAP